MTTPPPLLLLLLLELHLLQILPSVGELDLSGEGLQPLELLPPDKLGDRQVDGCGPRSRPGDLHQLLDQDVVKAHGRAHRRGTSYVCLDYMPRRDAVKSHILGG